MFNQTNVTELNLKSSQFELVLRKDQPSVSPVASSQPPAVVIMDSPSPTPEPTPPPQSNRKTIDIPSPMVGTFYRAPAPDEPAFVDIGDTVRKGQVVCIIEAMKLMNEIEAEVNGQVVEILVENGEPIEYGQPLLRILPT